MHITKMTITNFLGLSSWKADSFGKMNLISGANGVGKSAILKAINEGLKSSGVDPFMIYKGTDKAEIIIEIDDRILVNRKLTSSSNGVTVTVDGQPMNAPQKWINSIFGLGSNLNPLDFFNPKPPKGMTPARYRRELLLSAMPFTLTPGNIVSSDEIWKSIDLKDIDWKEHGLLVLSQIQKIVYERRHEIGQDVTRQSKAIEQDIADMPEKVDGKKWQDFNVLTATNEVAKAQSLIEGHKKDEMMLENLRRQSVSEAEAIERMEEELKTLRARHEETIQKGSELKKKFDLFKIPDTAELNKQIGDYDGYKRLAIKMEDIECRNKDLEKSEAVQESLDNLYKTLTTEIPRAILAQMKMPIKGLEIKGDDITVDGIDIDKLNTAEQVKLAVKIARALSGELKVICIDGFEHLDVNARMAFMKEAESDDFEYFFTVVNQDPEADGKLKLEVYEEKPKEELPPEKPTRQSKSKAGF